MSEGISIKTNYSTMIKNHITKILDEKIIIIEDFIRRKDFSPREIVLENKADIDNSTNLLLFEIKELRTLIKEKPIEPIEKDSIDYELLFNNININNIEDNIVTKFESIVDNVFTKELTILGRILELFVEDLKHLDKLDNLDILKNLESLEALNNLKDLDKLQNLSYIEKLQELSKLSKLDCLDGIETDIEFLTSEINRLDKLDNIERNIKSLLFKSDESEKSIIDILNSKQKQINNNINNRMDNIHESILSILADTSTTIPEQINDNINSLKDDIYSIQTKIINMFDRIDSILSYVGTTIPDKILGLSLSIKRDISNIITNIFESKNEIIENYNNMHESTIAFIKDIESKLLYSFEKTVLTIEKNKVIEVFDKKDLPFPEDHTDQKAIVLKGFNGAKVYKSDGIKWIKI